MVNLTTPLCDFGKPAPDFALSGTDGYVHSRDSVKGSNGLLVIFACNHCPYVKAIFPGLVQVCDELKRYGIGSVMINSNDHALYEEDSYAHMKAYAKAWELTIPYLHDETQAIAQDYGAICTPDFFGYNGELELQYRGRFHAGGKTPPGPDTRIDLLDAMKQVAMLGQGPRDQYPGIGCSIKWRD